MIRKRLLRQRKGFTLVEQMVAIASVAVVAAVVVPSVLNQIDKAEISRMQNDLLALEKATKNFRTDVSYWPGSILQLRDALADIAADVDQADPIDVFGNPILSTVFNNWKGPYFEPKSFQTVEGLSTDVLASAAGTYFSDGLEDISWTPPGSSTAQLFMKIDLNNVSLGDAAKLNLAIDADGSLTSGRVRWASSTCGGTNTDGTAQDACSDGVKGTLTFLAGPID